MAGNYPDPPSYRLAWDRDGSKLFRLDTSYASVITEHSQATQASLNSDTSPLIDGGGASGGTFRWGVMFPELTDLDALNIAMGYDGWFKNFEAIQVSSNTTNMIDGTWTAVSGVTASNPNKVATRTEIRSSTLLGIRAIRWGCSGNYPALRRIHLYGEPSNTAGDRMLIWDPVLDSRIAPDHFEWGDVPRESIQERTFRIKNRSTTLTAQSVRVAMEVLNDTTPSIIAQHQLSVDGTTWLAQVNIGDLAPGAVSAPITLRYTVDPGATLSLWTLRLFAEATTWGVAA